MFKEEEDVYNLYEKVIDYIESIIIETKGKESARFYEHTINLLNSINNAGCEDRRSQQIEYLWSIQRQIADKYEDYLP